MERQGEEGHVEDITHLEPRRLLFEGNTSKKAVQTFPPDPRDEMIKLLREEIAELKREKAGPMIEKTSPAKIQQHESRVQEVSSTPSYSRIPTYVGDRRSPPHANVHHQREKEIVSNVSLSGYKLSIPFSTRLMNASIPRHLQTMQPISIGKYTGETDPSKHLDAYVYEALFLGADEDVMCRMFPRTLTGEALSWFKGLPSGSIDSWEDMATAFGSHFVISRDTPRTSHTLAQIKQGDKEPLKDFLKRFYKEAAMVPDLTETIQLHILIEAIQPKSPFALSLAKGPPSTMDEFRRKASKYVGIEMHLEATAARQKPPTPAPRQEKEKDHFVRNDKFPQREKAGNAPFKQQDRRVSNFTHYAPLNASHSQILREVGWTSLNVYGIQRPPPIRRGGNPRKYCEFHEQSGHTTEECKALKNTIEVLIREGKLKQYLFKNKSNDEPER